jgi:hypothetical protein
MIGRIARRGWVPKEVPDGIQRQAVPGPFTTGDRGVPASRASHRVGLGSQPRRARVGAHADRRGARRPLDRLDGRRRRRRPFRARPDPCVGRAARRRGDRGLLREVLQRNAVAVAARRPASFGDGRVGMARLCRGEPPLRGPDHRRGAPWRSGVGARLPTHARAVDGASCSTGSVDRLLPPHAVPRTRVVPAPAVAAGAAAGVARRQVHRFPGRDLGRALRGGSHPFRRRVGASRWSSTAAAAWTSA